MILNNVNDVMSELTVNHHSSVLSIF